MYQEIGYHTYAAGTQLVSTIQGYPVNGILLMLTKEETETTSYLTIKGPTQVLVPRIQLDMLHQLSDYEGGNTDDDTSGSVAFIYINLGLVALDDGEEIQVIVDCGSAPASGTGYVGIAAVIDELPEHAEQQYSYDVHTDTSFSADFASALYCFIDSITAHPEIIQAKIGDDTRTTTVRATNWAANLMGKIKADNVTMGVVFEQTYGQPLVVNHGLFGLTCIVRRVVQAAPLRQQQAAVRLARYTARRLQTIDKQTLQNAGV